MARNILTSTRSAEEGNLPYYHLPKGLLRLTLAAGQEPTCSVVIVPDSEHRYFLRYNGNAFTSDKIDVSFTKEGFLKEISTTIKDETGEVIRAIGDLGVEAAKALAGAGTGTRGGDGVPAIAYDRTFDPFDEESLAEVNADLESLKAGFTVSIRPFGKAEEESSVDFGRNRFGVYCRPVAPFEVLFKNKTSIMQKLLNFPHPTVINFVEIPTASFVESTFSMTFGFEDDPLYAGYPNKISVQNPSSALAIMKTPIDVLRALISIPAQIFQLKFDIATGRANTAVAEQGMMNALKTREVEENKIKRELDQFRREVKQDKEDIQKKVEDSEQRLKREILES